MSIASKILRSALLASALVVTGAASLPTLAQAAEEVNLTNGMAVHGYDVVAYFTEGKPVEGNGSYTASYNGASYQFSNAKNRDMFMADPAKFAPQYGGFCAFGTAMGRKFDGDPQAWTIKDGKLYLNLNKKVQARWSKDIPGFVKGADHNWSIIETVADAKLENSPPSGLTQGAQ